MSSSNSGDISTEKKDIPVKKVRLDHTILSKYIQDIRNKLDDYVIGQDDAKEALCASLARTIIDNPKRKKPLGSFIFLGPSGVGKTELVRALFRILYGDEDIELGGSKVDCSILKEGHGVSDLIGPPVGYVGEAKIPTLSDVNIFKHFRVAQTKNSLHPLVEMFDNFGILLLDEVEKAHPFYYDLFLSIMDEGTIELRTGNTELSFKKHIQHSKFTNFRNVLVIMTSNLGAKELADKASGHTHVMGFDVEDNSDTLIPKEFYKEKLEEFFRPEFINRFTDYIPFSFLKKEEYYKILDMHIDKHNDFYNTFGVKMKLSKSLSKNLVDSALNNNYGARGLINELDLKVVTRFTRVLNNEQIMIHEQEHRRTINTLFFDIVDSEITVDGIFDEDHLDQRKLMKKRYKKSQKRLASDEIVVSLNNESMLITLRDNIIPSVSYLRALYNQKEKINIDFTEEIDRLEIQLSSWGLTDKDFTLMKSDVLIQKYEDISAFYANVKGVRLWGEGQFNSTFNGQLRSIEKYIRHYFKMNTDLKESMDIGAGTLDEIIEPIFDMVKSILLRDLTFDEENIVLHIFRREYLKLKEKPSLPEPTLRDKVKTEKTKVESKASTKDAKLSQIIVNINLGKTKKKKSNYKQRLKNLFVDHFDDILHLIKINVADDDDLMSILISVKDELGYEMNGKQNAAVVHTINKMLKQKRKQKNKKE